MACASQEAAEIAVASNGERQTSITVTLQTKSGSTAAFSCEAGENLLYAGLRHGLTLPYECATGTCGTCRARLLAGAAELTWTAAPGLAYVKRDRGEILLCQARADSDCAFRVPAKVIPLADGAVTPAYRRGVITNTKRLTHDVVHIDVSLDEPIRFEAGQFVVIETPDVRGGRAYSMVNYAPETSDLQFVVKRKPGGGFSNWLFENNVAGAPLRVFGPLGKATFNPAEARNVLCIAGGSGIAGMMAIAERCVQVGHFRNHTGHMFFGVRSMADCFYLAELSRLVAASDGKLEVTIALSEEATPADVHPDFPAVALAGGFVHEVAARKMAGRYNDIVGFVAGPPPMVDGALRMLIMEARLPAQFIRYDKFG